MLSLSSLFDYKPDSDVKLSSRYTRDRFKKTLEQFSNDVLECLRESKREMLISEIETAIDAPKMRVYTALVRLKKYGFIQSSVRASDKPKEGRCPKRYASTDKNGAYVQDRTKKAAFRGSAVIAYLRKYGDGKTLSQIANGLHLNKELVSSLLQSMKKRGMIITEKKITGGEYSFYSYAGGVVTVNNRAHLLYSINPSYED